jgi:hypothetical protein
MSFKITMTDDERADVVDALKVALESYEIEAARCHEAGPDAGARYASLLDAKARRWRLMLYEFDEREPGA